jgi:hypothetical protein
VALSFDLNYRCLSTDCRKAYIANRSMQIAPAAIASVTASVTIKVQSYADIGGPTLLDGRLAVGLDQAVDMDQAYRPILAQTVVSHLMLT